MKGLLGPSSLVVVVAMLAVGFVPLFGGPGYESALAAGLVLGPSVAVSVAWRVARGGQGPLWALGLGASRAALLGGLAAATLLLHGLRVGFCSAAEGLGLYALGPWAGAFVAGAWGAAAGSAARRASTSRRRAVAAVALGLAGPVGSALVSGLRFVTSPIVFAFDPFVGFFSGTLYDTVIDGTERLVSYRLGSLASLAALWCAAGLAPRLLRRVRGEAAEGAESGAEQGRDGGGEGELWLRGAVGALSLVASVGVTAEGPALGHYQTTESIRKALGGRQAGALCEVVHPATMRDEDAALFVRDCEQQLRAVSAYFEVEPRPVTAFLFADAGQKRRLMGAADTYVAKPWRREVYVQVAGYPHPVLGHELAHVAAGQAARGPFRVAGALGGVWPDPGLIEGVAVAASPDDDELSPEAWSRAMLDLGILPPVHALFSLDFFGHDANRAYTVAGAFVGWVRRGYGAAAVRRWYGGEALAAVTGKGWGELEEAFSAHLRSLPIPQEALALARSRFDRPSVFHRRCPHEVDAKKRDASGLLAAGDARGALRALDAVAALAPREPSAALLRATCSERLGRLDEAAGALGALLPEGAASRQIRDRAEERLGDLALGRGDLGEARARYEAVQARVLDEDYLRTLEVKLLATRDELSRPALLSLLVGSHARGVDPVGAAEDLARWAERSPRDGVPLYLLGRNALARGQIERGAALLDQALERELPLPRVAREAGRQRVIVGCMQGDREGVARGLAAWERAGAPPGNRDALLRALAERCLR